MSPRERLLAVCVLLVVVLLVGGFLFHSLFLGPLEQHNQEIQAMRQQIQTKQDRVRQIEADLPRLDRMRRMSLPAESDKSRRQYGDFLSELARDSGFPPSTSIVPPRQVDDKSAPAINKTPIYKKLDYNIQAHTSLSNLVTMLEKFYKTGLLHQVKKLSIVRPLTPGQQPTDLDITITVEALILDGAEKRQDLLPGISPKLWELDVIAGLRGAPTAVTLLPWMCGPTGPFGPGTLARKNTDYAAIGDTNIFLGPAPPERKAEEVAVTRFVHLNHITHNDKRWEAWLYNRYDNKWTRLRAEAGFDFFRILNEKGDTLVRGKVVTIDPREIVFKVDDTYYSVHIDQTLDDAMKKPLTSEQRKAVQKPAPPMVNGNGNGNGIKLAPAVLNFKK